MYGELLQASRKHCVMFFKHFGGILLYGQFLFLYTFLLILVLLTRLNGIFNISRDYETQISPDIAFVKEYSYNTKHWLAYNWVLYAQWGDVNLDKHQKLWSN